MSAVYKALADPTRRRILELLREKAMTAGELSDHFDLAKPTLSGHFAVLKAADLIDAEKSGTTILYRLNLSVLEGALMALIDTFQIGREAVPIRRPVPKGEIRMKLLKALIPAWIALLVYVAFTLWARARMPDAPIAVHFNVHMIADRYEPRDKALFRSMAIVAGLLAVLTAAPFMAPPRGALERSAKAYGVVCFAIVACICLLLSNAAFQALHWPIDAAQLLAVTLGLLFAVTGNYLTKVRPNFIYGVRTPWTLANEAVWDKTHRLAGPLMVLGGLLVLIGGLLAPRQVMLFVLVGVVIPAILTIPYSWWLWSQLPPEDKRRIRVGA